MKILGVKSFEARSSRLLPVGLILLFLASCAGVEQSEVSEQDTIREISQLMRNVSAAYKKRDASTLSELFLDDYRITLPNGAVLDKNAALDAAREDRFRIADPEVDDISIRRFGDFALLTAQIKVEMEIDGVSYKGVFRGGTGFVRRDGKWKIVDEYIGIPVSKD